MFSNMKSLRYLRYYIRYFMTRNLIYVASVSALLVFLATIQLTKHDNTITEFNMKIEVPRHSRSFVKFDRQQIVIKYKSGIKLNGSQYKDRAEYEHHREQLIEEREKRKLIEIEQLKREAKNITSTKHCGNNITRESYYRPSSEIVNSFNYNILYNTKPNFCSDKTFLVILVASYHDNTHKRLASRKTWAQLAITNSNLRIQDTVVLPIKVVFLFGLHIEKEKNDLVKAEHKAYGDIVIGDFMETYENLIVKTQFGLKWSKDYCRGAKYVMKADDDIFINIPQIMKLLTSKYYTRTIIGCCYKRAHVLRTKLNATSLRDRRASSWALTCDQFPFDKFPDYTSGHGYIIPMEFARELYKLSLYKRPFNIEDVFVTGVLRIIAGSNASLECFDGFSDAFNLRPFPIEMSEKILTYAFRSPEEATQLWTYILERKSNTSFDSDINNALSGSHSLYFTSNALSMKILISYVCLLTMILIKA